MKNARREQIERAERARKIHSKITSRIEDLQVLKGGLIMTNKTFRTMLKEHPSLKLEFDILTKRKECIRMFVFQNA